MSTGHGERLSRLQERAIIALLTSPTVEAAAASIRVAPKTLQRWQQIPAFAAAFRAAKQSLLNMTVARLLGLSDKALRALERNVESANAAASNRAAELILGYARSGMEATDVLASLDELKSMVAELKSDTEQRQDRDTQDSDDAGSAHGTGPPTAG